MTTEWAQHYVTRGFSLVPLHHVTRDRCSCGRYPCGVNNRSAGKHPTTDDWTKRGVMTLEEAGHWPPLANIGLRMGGPGRHVVLDVDGEAGRASLAALELELGALPPTMTTRSGREGGGEHRIFTLAPGDDVATVSNSASALGAGLDVKAEGGQVVAPPSLHASGRRYEAVDTRPPAELPAAWYARLPKRAKAAPTADATSTRDADPGRMRRASAYLATIPPAVEGVIVPGTTSTGGTHTFATAVKIVRGFSLTDDAAFQVMTPWNARCSPPWSEDGLRRKIREAAEKGDMPWGTLAPASPSAVATFSVLEAADIFAALPDVAYLVLGLGITPGAPTLIAGYGYSGKTVAVQQLAIDLARPEPEDRQWMNPRPVWSKFSATKRAKVLHVDYEQGHRLTRRRYQRLARAAGVTAEELDGWLRLVSLPELYLNTPAGLAALERLCDGTDLVIVDSFRAANPGLEENSSDAREPLDALNRISERVGCSSIVIHHARKPSADKPGGAKMSIRGSGAIFDGSASVLVFDGEKDKPKLVSHEKERNSGITVDDFELTIEDAEGDGVVVRAKDIVRQTPEEKLDAQTKEQIEKIRAHLAKVIYARGREELREILNVRPGRVGVLISAMLTSGELVNDGSPSRPVYHLSGVAPVVNGAANV